MRARVSFNLFRSVFHHRCVFGARRRTHPTHSQSIDVAFGMVNTLSKWDAPGRTYEFAGPKTYTQREFMTTLGKSIGARHDFELTQLRDVSYTEAMLRAKFRQMTPQLDFTLMYNNVDMIEQWHEDRVQSSSPERTLADCGVTSAISLESQLPTLSLVYQVNPMAELKPSELVEDLTIGKPMSNASMRQ